MKIIHPPPKAQRTSQTRKQEPETECRETVSFGHGWVIAVKTQISVWLGKSSQNPTLCGGTIVI